MKYKTTKKAVNSGYTYKIAVGYCNLQNLLYYERPVAYNTRVEGWAADIYDCYAYDDYNVGRVAIVTGYAPFGNIRPTYEVYQKYEKEAERIRYSDTRSYDAKKRDIRQLIKEFIREVTPQ